MTLIHFPNYPFGLTGAIVGAGISVMSLAIGLWTLILALIGISRSASKMSWPGRTVSFALGASFTVLFFHWEQPSILGGQLLIRFLEWQYLLRSF